MKKLFLFWCVAVCGTCISLHAMHDEGLGSQAYDFTQRCINNKQLQNFAYSAFTATNLFALKNVVGSVYDPSIIASPAGYSFVRNWILIGLSSSYLSAAWFKDHMSILSVQVFSTFIAGIIGTLVVPQLAPLIKSL